MTVLIECKVVASDSIEELNTLMNNAVSDGFIPNSGISCCMCSTDSGTTCMYTQLMIKYGE